MAKLILMGQPVDNDGYFAKSFRDPTFKNVTISCYDSPNVTGEFKMEGLVTPDWIEERKVAWGEDDTRYRVRVLGEFPIEGSDNRIVPESLIAAAMNMIPASPTDSCLMDAGNMTASGVDVAGGGPDSTVHTIIKNGLVHNVAALEGMQLPTAIAEWVAERNIEHGVHNTIVDVTGVGYGAYAELRKIANSKPGVGAVRSITMNQKSTVPHRYRNMRTEVIYKGIEALKMCSVGLPQTSTPLELYQDLRAIWYTVAKNGSIEAEPKKNTHRRLGRSPDWADSFFLAVKAMGALGYRTREQYVDDLWNKFATQMHGGTAVTAGRY
jgi:hypothetical protein